MHSLRKSASLSCRRFSAVFRVVYRDATPPLALSVFFTALPPACFVCFDCFAILDRDRARERPRRVGGGRTAGALSERRGEVRARARVGARRDPMTPTAVKFSAGRRGDARDGVRVVRASSDENSSLAFGRPDRITFRSLRSNGFG